MFLIKWVKALAAKPDNQVQSSEMHMAGETPLSSKHAGAHQATATK